MLHCLLLQLPLTDEADCPNCQAPPPNLAKDSRASKISYPLKDAQSSSHTWQERCVGSCDSVLAANRCFSLGGALKEVL